MGHHLLLIVSLLGCSIVGSSWLDVECWLCSVSVRLKQKERAKNKQQTDRLETGHKTTTNTKISDKFKSTHNDPDPLLLTFNLHYAILCHISTSTKGQNCISINIEFKNHTDTWTLEPPAIVFFLAPILQTCRI